MQRYPSTEFSKIVPGSYAKGYVSHSQSLHSIAMSGGGQRYEFDVTSAWERLPIARGYWMFLNARGEHDKFLIQLPIYDSPSGLVNGVVSAALSYAIGTNEVTFVNFEPASGDFIQFAGHSKVYGVETAAGNTATIYPQLMKAVVASEVVNVNDLTFTVRRKGAVQKLESDRARAAKVSFSIYEAF